MAACRLEYKTLNLKFNQNSSEFASFSLQYCPAWTQRQPKSERHVDCCQTEIQKKLQISVSRGRERETPWVRESRECSGLNTLIFASSSPTPNPGNKGVVVFCFVSLYASTAWPKSQEVPCRVEKIKIQVCGWKFQEVEIYG